MLPLGDSYEQCCRQTDVVRDRGGSVANDDRGQRSRQPAPTTFVKGGRPFAATPITPIDPLAHALRIMVDSICLRLWLLEDNKTRRSTAIPTL